jgi:large subunit ribosomal protein L14e
MVKQSDTRVHIGQVVQVTQGRDNEKYAIVLSQLDERFVLIADGDKRKFDRPKKKNILHLKFMDYVAEEVRKSLIDTGRVTNSKLRYALNKFVEHLPKEQSKGE